MSYVDVFSGNTIQPANKSYNTITLNQNITLSWPSQFLDTGNVVASWMDINATVFGRTLTLPDSRFASNGQQIVIVNAGNQTFNLLKNDGNILLQNIATGTAVCICLFDNSTSAGQWRSIPFGQGQTAVSQVAATAPARGFTIAGSPITNNGTFVFALANMLAALEQLAAVGNKGFIVQKGDSQLVIRKIESDDTNVVVENQDGNADDIKIKLNPNGLELISAILGNIAISGNSIVSKDQNGDINITPDGTGLIKAGKDLELATNKKVQFLTTEGNVSENYLSEQTLKIAQAILGRLSLSQNIIASLNQDEDIILSPNGNGNVKSTKNFQLSSGKILSLYNNDNTSSVSFKNCNGTQNLAFDLPMANGTDNAIMQTNATGQLSFSPLTTIIANKQQMEGGASQVNPITPNNLIYARGSCKAWGVFNGVGSQQGETIPPIASYNVVQITKNGTGSYSVTMNKTFQNDMIFSVNVYQERAFQIADLCFVTAKQSANNAFNIYIVNKDGSTFVDYYRISFAIYGDLA